MIWVLYKTTLIEDYVELGPKPKHQLVIEENSSSAQVYSKVFQVSLLWFISYTVFHQPALFQGFSLLQKGESVTSRTHTPTSRRFGVHRKHLVVTHDHHAAAEVAECFAQCIYLSPRHPQDIL